MYVSVDNTDSTLSVMDTGLRINIDTTLSQKKGTFRMKYQGLFALPNK